MVPAVFVRGKANELWDWLTSLEAIKYDHCEMLKRQRYEVSDGKTPNAHGAKNLQTRIKFKNKKRILFFYINIFVLAMQVEILTHIQYFSLHLIYKRQ